MKHCGCFEVLILPYPKQYRRADNSCFYAALTQLKGYEVCATVDELLEAILGMSGGKLTSVYYELQSSPITELIYDIALFRQFKEKSNATSDDKEQLEL